MLYVYGFTIKQEINHKILICFEMNQKFKYLSYLILLKYEYMIIQNILNEFSKSIFFINTTFLMHIYLIFNSI